jgi:two-component system, NarL family, nitrate/nitrite response regulator NarL
MNETRILIVSDNPLARAGLAAMLAGQPGLVLLGQVTGDDPLNAFEPGVVLWDVGWQADLQQLKANDGLAAPLLVLVPDAAQGVAVWALGVQAVLLRTTPVETLSVAISAVAAGLIVLDAALTDLIDTTPPADETLSVELTPRESEVLQLLAEGLSNKGIAFQLGISDHTVKFHVNAIMTKFDAQSRTEAAVKAARLGLITL